MTLEISFHSAIASRKLPTWSIGDFQLAEESEESDISAMRLDLPSLVRARLDALHINAFEAARRMGNGTGRDFVNDILNGKKKSIRGDKLGLLARALDCSPEYLVGQQEEPGYSRAPTVRLLGRARANPDGSYVMTTASESWDQVPLVPGATSEAVALIVLGDSMHTRAPDRSLIYFDHQQPEPPSYLVGEACVVETEDGRVLYKYLQRGSGPGLYDLLSDVGEPIRDARLAWVAEVLVIVPPRHARRILLQANVDAA